eukprot:scaffold187_cov140-Skeletonema_marinoi.AAC.4
MVARVKKGRRIPEDQFPLALITIEFGRKRPKVISRTTKRTSATSSAKRRHQEPRTILLVGLVSNLHRSNSRKARLGKIISLDLHGLSKKQALETLEEHFSW